MRILLIFLIVSFILSSFTTLHATIDYSATGWTASTGLNTLTGRAYGTQKIGRGYYFWCLGISSTCYDIFGNTLIIYDFGESQQDDDGVYVVVLEN